MPRQRPNKPKRPRLKDVSIRVEHREKVDGDRFAYATLRHAKIVLAREEAKKQKDGGSS